MFHSILFSEVDPTDDAAALSFAPEFHLPYSSGVLLTLRRLCYTSIFLMVFSGGLHPSITPRYQNVLDVFHLKTGIQECKLCHPKHLSPRQLFRIKTHLQRLHVNHSLVIGGELLS
jgi:hypothetical protein